MSLEKKINADFIQAMKDKNAEKKQVLSFIRAEMKNVSINEGKREAGLEDSDVIAVLKRHQKKLKDTYNQMKEAGRDDLALEAQAELVIVDEYLPEEMTEEQIVAIVDEVIAETGAMNMKDMGNVMKAVLVKTAGTADNAIVSTVVRSKLS